MGLAWCTVRVVEGLSSGSLPPGLGSELAGLTSKSILKSGDSQHSGREGGWSSHHVKTKQREGQGRSRFGGGEALKKL